MHGVSEVCLLFLRIKSNKLIFNSGTPTEDYLDPRCYIPVNQYFWLNGLHPTYPIHDVMAEHIVKLLDSGPNVS
jgi:phospholipase/lecithinase/hemolysin